MKPIIKTLINVSNQPIQPGQAVYLKDDGVTAEPVPDTAKNIYISPDGLNPVKVKYIDPTDKE